MIKIAIAGIGGRMGAALCAAARSHRGLKVVGGVEQAGKTAAEHLRTIEVVEDARRLLDKADVFIDFTTPEATLKMAPLVAAAGKALVVGTTGLTGEARDEFVKSVAKVPVVFSPNMSLSANVLFAAAEQVARLLPDYDAEITEVHHNLKKDSPSGTAQRLAEAVQKGRGKGRFVYGRHGLIGERKSDEIGVHALRGGDVVGDHAAFFFGQGERIELVHRVTSREAFAQGALAAAKWVADRPAGLYDMRDVLGLSKNK